MYRGICLWDGAQPREPGVETNPAASASFEPQSKVTLPVASGAPCPVRGESARTRVPVPSGRVGRRGLPEVRPQALRADDPPGDPPGVPGTPARLAPPTPGRDFSRTDFPGRCQPGLPVPGPRGGAGCSAEGGSGRRSLRDFVGQPWPRRRPQRRAEERGDARRAGRSGRWGPCERAQARPGARRAAACPRAAAPGRAPGGPPTTTGCSGDPGCSDRGAAPAAGLGPPGVGSTSTPDPRVLSSARLGTGCPGVPGTPGPPAVDLPRPSHSPPVVAPVSTCSSFPSFSPSTTLGVGGRGWGKLRLEGLLLPRAGKVEITVQLLASDPQFGPLRLSLFSSGGGGGWSHPEGFWLRFWLSPGSQDPVLSAYPLSNPHRGSSGT